MSYRDPSESLRSYRDRIAQSLEEARRASREAADRASQVAILERELEETTALLDKMGTGKRGLPLLDDVRIAAPCTANWDDMVGSDQVRHCTECAKNVYNVSSMTRQEAEALLVARNGAMCVRLYKRSDGTVLTEDCPVGVTKRRRVRAAVAAVGGGLMAAAAALGLQRTQGAVVSRDLPVPVTGVFVAPPSEPTARDMDLPALTGSAVAPNPPVPPKMGRMVLVKRKPTSL